MFSLYTAKITWLNCPLSAEVLRSSVHGSFDNDAIWSALTRMNLSFCVPLARLIEIGRSEPCAVSKFCVTLAPWYARNFVAEELSSPNVIALRSVPLKVSEFRAIDSNGCSSVGRHSKPYELTNIIAVAKIRKRRAI